MATIVVTCTPSTDLILNVEIIEFSPSTLTLTNNKTPSELQLSAKADTPFSTKYLLDT